jgi:hypothetical protein
MKNLIILIGLLIIPMDIYSQNEIIVLRLYPSFHDSSSIVINRHDNNSITLNIRQNKWWINNVSDTLISNITNILNHNEIWIGQYHNEPTQYIVASGDTLPSIMLGTDGITINGYIQTGTTFKKFEFWSPDKGQISHTLMSDIFKLINEHFSNDTIVRYFESIEGYFDLGLGLKLLSKDPLIYKIYGSITSNDLNDIENFFKGLNKNQKVIIDLTNLSGMGTMFYPIISNLIKDKSNILWKVDYNKPALNHLYKIGVPNDKILSDFYISKYVENESGTKIKYKRKNN